MDSPRSSRAGWLYGLAFLFALIIRLIQLGAFPLTDPEAASALQALQVAGGAHPAVGPQTAYVLLTSVLFFIFGSSNFLARLIPALIGSLLVFVPFFFQERLKPRPALILAFFLALDPGFFALSRQAGSGILSVAFLLFAWGLWEHKSQRAAGILAALAFLSGPALWPGLLALGITWGILRFLEPKPSADHQPLAAVQWRQALISFALTLVLFGTLFFFIPSALSNSLSSIGAYFRGWVAPSGVPASRLVFSFLPYQPLVLLLALVAIVRGWINGSRRVIRLSIWMLAALLLAVFYPARQVHDVIWALIPMSALAALELARHLKIHPEERREVAGVALLTILILVFAWLDFASITWTPPSIPQATLRVWLLFGSLFLWVVSILLVAVGWSLRTARLGAVWGLFAVLGIFTLGASFRAGGLDAQHTPEFWASGPYPVHADLIASTIHDLSQWGRGNIDALPVTISGLKSPALQWALRDHQVTVTDVVDPSSAPAFLITPLENQPALAATYRGQDFTWNEQPTWNSVVLNDWLRWLVVRDMPESYDTILLWARNDVFIDASHSDPTAP